MRQLNYNSRFIRLPVQKETNTSSGDVELSWDVPGSTYYGCLMELSAKETDTMGRTLSDTTAKIVLNNVPDLDEQDILQDKATDFLYYIDGLTIDYLQSKTTAYVHRYKGEIHR